MAKPVPRAITAVAVEGLPEVRPGDDLRRADRDRARAARGDDAASRRDVLVMAHKVVSKAEGRLRRARRRRSRDRGRYELAAKLGKDPRHVQVVLDESQRGSARRRTAS